MSNGLESLFGGSLVDLAEKAGTRLNEAEQRIQNCESKSEYALENVAQIEVNIKKMIDLIEKINLRFDMFENDVVTKITARLDKLEYNKSCRTETKEYVKESKNNEKEESVKELKSDSKQVENVNKDTSNDKQVRDEHVKNDLLDKRVKRDRYSEQSKMKALCMLDELSVVSESR
jgi:hypothetical protein